MQIDDCPKPGNDAVARAAYERFELCDHTTDGTDPRWKVWDRTEYGYLPGYWPSKDAAYEGAKDYLAQITPAQTTD